MRPVEGTLLGNRYKLTSRIAVGGMGEVWKGVDSVLGREVAAKILKDEYLSDSTFLARFRAEAQNMGRVSDPGIAGVYDYGDEDGSPYLVMEYVPGEALSAIIERSAPLSETDTLSIVTQAAQALGAAHKVGVIHRDIKPGNILMTPDFRVKITDFGIARVTDQAPLTKTGQVMGTAQYLAPEQATGKGSGPGSDLYALGIIAYEALAGQRPFTGDSQVAIAIAQVNQQHPPLPDTVSEPLRRFVDCLLEKKPDRRPSDAVQVAKASEALSAGDVAAAEEFVPQMRHGNAASEALTQVFNNPDPVPSTKALPVTAANDATQVYPNNGPGTSANGFAPAAGAAGAGAGAGALDAEDPDGQTPEGRESKKGRALIWILAIVALIAVGGLLWFFLGGGNAQPEPTPTDSETTSEAKKTVEIDVNDYIGLTESSATQNLENQGLKAETKTIESSRAEGTVADVGEGENGYTFEEGDTVTLYISSGPAEQPQPTKEPSKTEEPTLGNDSKSSSDSDSSSSSDSKDKDSNEKSSSNSNSSSSGSNSNGSNSSSSADESGSSSSSDSNSNQNGDQNGSDNGSNSNSGSNSSSNSSSDNGSEGGSKSSGDNGDDGND